MAEARARSGGGKTVATFPSGGGGGGGGAAAGGGGMYGMGSFGGVLDPNLLRQALLQGLEQRNVGFNEWLKNQEQRRRMAEMEMTLAGEEGRRKEREFYQRNIPTARRIPTNPAPMSASNISARGAAYPMIMGG